MKKTVLCGCLVLASVAWANPVAKQISGASEAGRQKFFANVLNASGEKCPAASRTFYQGEDKSGAAYWNIQCTNGRAYQMQIANNARGSTKTLDCEMLIKINAGACFKSFK